MSLPFELAEARAASLNWLAAAGVTGPPEWLDWLGLQARPGAERFAASPVSLAAPLAELRREGMLGEVVFSALVQSAWPPNSNGLECRTRAELVVYFRAEEAAANRPIDLDELREINQTRLQELTPQELIELSREFWPSSPDPADFPALEAWALIHVDQYATLLDVARILSAFWVAPAPSRNVSFPPNWWELLQEGRLDEALQQELHELLVGHSGPNDVQLIASLLGEDRCRERVSHE